MNIGARSGESQGSMDTQSRGALNEPLLPTGLIVGDVSIPAYVDLEAAMQRLAASIPGGAGSATHALGYR